MLEIRSTKNRKDAKHISYVTCKSHLAKLTKTVISREVFAGDREVIIGTHAFRKTGILLACWWFLSQAEKGRETAVAADPMVKSLLFNDARSADANSGGIMDQMRHRTVNKTKSYLDDVATLFHQVSLQHPNDPMFKATPHKSIYVHHLQRFGSLIKNNCEKSISQYADWFVFNKCGIKEHRIKKMTLLDIFQECCSKSPGYVEIPQQVSKSHKFLIEKMGLNAYHAFKELEDKESPVSGGFKSENRVSDVPKTQNNALVDLPDFSAQLKTCSSVTAKVKVCKDAYRMLCTDITKHKKRMFVDKQKCTQYTQLYSYARVCQCLKTCFGSDISAFSRFFESNKNKSFVPSKFKCPKGSTHAPKIPKVPKK